MAVRVIKATRPQAAAAGSEPKLLRVAAYCRVSTDQEEQETSYEAQCRHYTDYINANSEWELAGIFADEGISGTSTKNRTQFNAMIAACENGEVDMVITKSISRFARNTLDCLTYIRKLKALNIPIYFEKENINTLDAKGEILLTIMASIAQQESQSISQNVRMGIQYGFQEGRMRLDYTRFLGYTKDADGNFVIVPEEAETVRRIYRDYLEGYSPDAIAKVLTAKGAPTPMGSSKWYASTVASILSNEKYCGDALLQKYYTVDFLTHKIAKNTSQFPQYFVEDHHAPIVPRQVYFQVQGEMMRRASLKNEPLKIRCGVSMALSGRLVCDKCGRTLKRFTKQDGRETDWRCRRRAGTQKVNQRDIRSACGCRFVPDSQAKAATLKAFNRLPEYAYLLSRNRAQIIEGDIKRLDALIEANKLTEERMGERLEQLEAENGGEAAYISTEIARLQAERNGLMLERAEHSNRELQIRLLLELVDEMEAVAKRCRDLFGSAEDVQRDAKLSHLRGHSEAPAEREASCTDYDEFFRRTHIDLPKGVLDMMGRLVKFDDAMVLKYVDHLTVTDDGFDVRFKAGVTVHVRATATLRALSRQATDVNAGIADDAENAS